MNLLLVIEQYYSVTVECFNVVYIVGKCPKSSFLRNHSITLPKMFLKKKIKLYIFLVAKVTTEQKSDRHSSWAITKLN